MAGFETTSLPEEVRAWVEERVASGLYASPEEVLASAMRALEIFELQQKVEAGAQELERGEGRTYDDAGLRDLSERIKRQGRERLAAKQDSAPE